LTGHILRGTTFDTQWWGHYIIGLMKRILMTSLTLWVLLLSPGLCLSGTLEHLCADNPTGDSCEHENDCASDPCGELLLVQAGNLYKSLATPMIPSNVNHHEESDLICRTAADAFPNLRIQRVNLPVPPSDLPLVI